MRDLWWNARDQAGAWRKTQAGVTQILQPVVQQITTALQAAGITGLTFGIRGSLATGYKFDETPGQPGRPWDALDFDVDAYVKSDALNNGIPSSTSFKNLRNLDSMQGFRPGQTGNAAANIIISLIVQAERSLRNAFPRLRGTFTFKVFSGTSNVTGLNL